jgi:hypothetical protein
VRILGVVLALVTALALGLSPVPGEWRSGAGVSFAVDPGTGLVQPAVRVPRCGHHRPRVVSLGLAAAPGGRFAVARRRIRLSGRFESSSSAHGVVRFRGSAHHPCRIVRHWTAHPIAPLPGPADDADQALDDPDAIIDDDEPIEDGDYDEDDGPIDEP